MRKLERLQDFKMKDAELRQIRAGKAIYDYDTGTQQVGGGYCTSAGYDCQDAIYNDDGGVIGWAPIVDTAPPDPGGCYTG